MLEVVETKKLLPKVYGNMLNEISEFYPKLEVELSQHRKTQTQFMDNMLTVSLPTDLRNARQILAEVERSKMALEEAYFKMEENKIKIKKLKRDLLEENDKLEKELIQVKIRKAEHGIKNSLGYVQGAIRKIHNYITQYKRICEKLGKDNLTEEDFEKDEARYHVMRVFEQALCAARSHMGIIDEGNHIYLHQIGINGAMAQGEVTEYLNMEQDLIKKGIAPTHTMQMNWLEALGNKYAEGALRFAERKGMLLINDKSFHKIEEGV